MPKPEHPPIAEPQYKAIVSPDAISQLSVAIRAAVSGDYKVRLPFWGDSNLDRFTESFNMMVQALEQIEEFRAAGQTISDTQFESLLDSVGKAESLLVELSNTMLSLEIGQLSRNSMELRYKEVYGYCPPTVTHYKSQSDQLKYAEQWKTFMDFMGLPPKAFRGARLLDAGCGSCDKAIIYHDLGAQVTGLDMTPKVLEIGKRAIGTRSIRLIESSIFDLDPSEGPFDLIISDGVLHCTNDTYAGFRALLQHLKPGGKILISLVNIWGRFWWFEYARILTKLFGGSDFHLQVQWGSYLFAATRSVEEGTEDSAIYFRSRDSWAYDWFAAPRWNLHKPQEINHWLQECQLRHVRSWPSLNSQDHHDEKNVFNMSNWPDGPHIFWLANKEGNTMYFCAEKPRRSSLLARWPFKSP